VLAGLAFAMPNLFYPRVERHNDAAAAIEATGVTTRRTPRRWRAGRTSCPPRWSISGSTCAAARICWPRSQVEDVYEARMDSLWPEVRDALRDLRDTVGTIRRIDAPPGELHVRVSQPEGWPAPWPRCARWRGRSSA
jgi:hypothetical protein